MADYTNYAMSLSRELISIKDRIRNFIDDAHWGEDGRFKEVILMKLLREKLPKNVRVGTGFVRGAENLLTSQIDIIIYKESIPTLFEYDDFIIVTPASVLGIVEVKSNLNVTVLRRAIEKSHANGVIIGKDIFNGIFGYDENGVIIDNNRQKISASIRDTLRVNIGQVNHISVGKDYFIKYWEKESEFSMDELAEEERNYFLQARYSTYQMAELSFGYFISNLIYQIMLSSGEQAAIEEIGEYLYPISDGKKNRRLRNVDIF